MASVESVKAASDVYAPVSGVVVEANTELSSNPALVNAGAEAAGWFVKIQVADGGAAAATAGMLDGAAYAALCASEKH